MANQIETKKITTLTENTDLSDTDQFPFGAGGGSGLRRIKWINIWNKILAKMRAAIIVNNCTTTVAGYALDARQGKIIQDEVSELNTKLQVYYAYKEISASGLVYIPAQANKGIPVAAFSATNSVYLVPAYRNNGNDYFKCFDWDGKVATSGIVGFYVLFIPYKNNNL